jgi:uncharacterized phage protein gp47/JayE
LGLRRIIMAGLTSEGFTPLTYEEISTNIQTRLENFNPGFDFSPESPDGQMIAIMSVLIAQCWSELNNVFLSYDPSVASGKALRNLGLISGISQEIATSSSANIDLIGVAGTQVAAGSLVADSDGNEFYTVSNATIPASVGVLSVLAGPLEVPAGSIDTVVSVVTGWDSVLQVVDGTTGSTAISETHFRNLRNRTVLRNYTGVVDTMQARLLELGIAQAAILNNTDTLVSLPDGTPPLTVHATVGEVGIVTDEEIAKTIMDTIGIGIPTYGTTTVPVLDNQGVVQNISFSKAVEVNIFINLNITFLDDDIGGAEESIKAALADEINNLLAGEDVIWSQMFGLITPYGNAQVNGASGLQLQRNTDGFVSDNLTILDGEYTSIDPADIVITVV